MSYHRMILLLATKNCYELGMSVAELAKQGKVNRSTVYRRLRSAGVTVSRTMEIV